MPVDGSAVVTFLCPNFLASGMMTRKKWPLRRSDHFFLDTVAKWPFFSGHDGDASWEGPEGYQFSHALDLNEESSLEAESAY